MVSETHFFQENVSKTANYELFNVDRAYRGDNCHSWCGTAIYAKRGFNATFIKISILNYIEAIPIFLDFPHIPNLVIAATYVPPSNDRNLQEQFILLTNAFPNFILAGDFNATHPSWHCRSINGFGTKHSKVDKSKLTQITAPTF